MSVKIDTGFRLSITSTKQLHNEIENLRKKALVIAEEQSIKLIVRGIFQFYINEKLSEDKDFSFIKKPNSLFDFLFYSKESKEPTIKTLENINLFSYISESVEFIKRESLQWRVFPDDPSLTISIIPYKNKLLCQYYTEINDYIGAIKEIRTFEDYHYQNSSDKPKNITTRQWNKRYNDWNDALLKHNCINASDVSMMYNIITPDIITDTYLKNFFLKEQFKKFKNNHIIQKELDKTIRNLSTALLILNEKNNLKHYETIKLIKNKDPNLTRKLNEFIEKLKALTENKNAYELLSSILFP